MKLAGQVRVRKVCTAPVVRHLEGLLSVQEREDLIQASQLRMRPAGIYRDGRNQVAPDRRRAEICFHDPSFPPCAPLLAALEHVAGARAELVERIQVTHYLPGGGYKLHHDAIYPIDARQAAAGGQRAWSLLAYLEAPAEGGETTFPELGLQFAPTPGNAVLWSNLKADGTLDQRVFHAAEPVVRGEKWVAVAWVRERPAAATREG